MCEYAHAMGNSLGNMTEYWDLIRSRDNLIGGFIWDWKDQGLEQIAENGEKYLVYGGFFGDKPNDANFCINGIVDAYGKPKSMLLETQYIYQPVAFAPVDLAKGKVKVHNRHQFTDLAEFEVRWEIKADGDIVGNGVLEDFSLAGDGINTVTLPYNKPKIEAGKHYWLRLSVHLKQDQNWAGKGHEIAKQQFELPFYKESVGEIRTMEYKELTVADKGNSLNLSSQGFKVRFDKTTGWLNQVDSASSKLIAGELKPNFWRPKLDNDHWARNAKNGVPIWKDMPNKLVLTGFKHEVVNSSESKVTAKYKFEESINLTMSYLVSAYNEVKVDFDLAIDESMPDLIKVGMSTLVNKSLSNMSFYGKGPFENYIDRNAAAEIDVYKGNISDFLQPYVRPQENGNHTNVKWLSLENKLEGEQSRLFIESDKHMEVSVWPWSADDIASAKYSIDLIPAKFNTVNIDLIQTGVGGSTPGGAPARALPKYHIKAGKYQYGFTIKVN